jgi:hypothetical protein
MTFSSKIINYNSRYEESGHTGGRGITENEDEMEENEEEDEGFEEDDDDTDDEDDDDTTRVMRATAQFDLLAVDGDGRWRKETPGPDTARPIRFRFRKPDSKVQVARDIRRALNRQVEPVRRPPVPNPERDFTELQW